PAAALDAPPAPPKRRMYASPYLLLLCVFLPVAFLLLRDDGGETETSLSTVLGALTGAAVVILGFVAVMVYRGRKAGRD
ncbi:hypothetical protein ACFQ07_25160, partial [Actinomadura adrarensis]